VTTPHHHAREPEARYEYTRLHHGSTSPQRQRRRRVRRSAIAVTVGLFLILLAVFALGSLHAGR
jgi:hypothetical protein